MCFVNMIRRIAGGQERQSNIQGIRGSKQNEMKQGGLVWQCRRSFKELVTNFFNYWFAGEDRLLVGTRADLPQADHSTMVILKVVFSRSLRFRKSTTLPAQGFEKVQFF